MEKKQEFQLSERLLTIASHVSAGETVADIGTDHGYIPIWLLSHGITQNVILTDVNEGPLRKAQGNLFSICCDFPSVSSKEASK